MGRRVQARGSSLHTSRTGFGARVRSRYGSLPQRTMAVAHVPKNSGVTITCSRSADMGGERADVQGVSSPFHLLPQVQKQRRIRYRGVIVAAAPNGCRRDDRRCERSRGQLCEARCRTRRQLHRRGSRHRCRPDRGQRCGCRCAAKPRPARLGCMARMLGGTRGRRIQRRRACAEPDAAAERNTAGAAGASAACAKRGAIGHETRTRVAGTDAGGRLHRTAHMMPVVKHEESGRCREAPTAVSVAGADQTGTTIMPRRL